MEQKKNIRLGDVLIEDGYITEEQLMQALAWQKENRGKLIGEVLIELGYITEAQKMEALSKRLRTPCVDLNTATVDLDAVRLIPRPLAEKYGMLAIAQKDGVLTVVTDDPLNYYGMEDIRQVTGMALEVALSLREDVIRFIGYYYSEVGGRMAAQKANDSFAGPAVEEITVEEGDDDTPIINLLNSMIERAASNNASDIHIEPFEDKTLVRMRMDGVIVEYVTLQRSLHSSLIARIKILSDLDIAERRIPQDGHFRTVLKSGPINIRVSVLPTVFGEKAVLRLLAGNAQIDHVASYGMNAKSYDKFSRILQSPNGIIYLTGPTGSGKSTTLYMVLEELSKRPVNISTIEDPVEKNVPKLNQTQVNNTAGLTFETGLRALLRQDPDIIMVGETRDAETANISVRAAITGHLVFSTLHTNDAVSSIVRLVDMGLEPYMIANSLVGVVAQRLMRKVCVHCAVSEEPTEAETAFIGRTVKMVRRARGCRYCNFTGYRGRIAIHEILEIDKKVREMISAHATMEEIKEYARREQEMRTLKECGVELLEQGITTVEELRKVAYYE